MDYKMQLTPEEVAILNGNEGETKAKILKTLVLFGDAVGATNFIPIDCCGHLVTRFTKSWTKLSPLDLKHPTVLRLTLVLTILKT